MRTGQGRKEGDYESDHDGIRLLLPGYSALAVWEGYRAACEWGNCALSGEEEYDDEPNPLPMVAAVTLSSSAILAALVQSLHDKGVLDGEETVEIYETALHLLEMQQASADMVPGYGEVMDMARELIERHLRPAGD